MPVKENPIPNQNTSKVTRELLLVLTGKNIEAIFIKNTLAFRIEGISVYEGNDKWHVVNGSATVIFHLNDVLSIEDNKVNLK